MAPRHVLGLAVHLSARRLHQRQQVVDVLDEDGHGHPARLRVGSPLDPGARLLAIFDVLGKVIEDPDFRGCRCLSADLALADPDHPAHDVTRQYRVHVHELLENELVKLGHQQPASAADQLLLLIDGTLAAGVTRPGIDPARLARHLAGQIIGTDHDRQARSSSVGAAR
jgi:hypothetical protein